MYNVVLCDVNIGCDIIENFEDVFCIDFIYFLDIMIMLVDFGYCYSKVGSKCEDISLSVGFCIMEDSLWGDLFFELLVVGLDNFNDVDGCDLYVKDFLIIDLELVVLDFDGVFEIL